MLNKVDKYLAFFMLFWYSCGRWVTFSLLQYEQSIQQFSNNAIYNIIASITVAYLTIVIITKNWYNNFSKNKLLISIINKQKVVKVSKIYYYIITTGLFIAHAYYFSLMFIDLFHNNKIMIRLDILLSPLFLLYFSIQIHNLFKKLN